MRAHAHDLRAEVDEDAVVYAITADWRSASLDTTDRALCHFAEKLTQSPNDMTSADLDQLRAEGLDDVAIHDATQVISYFNYINRIADALGVEPEPFVKAWENRNSQTPI